jgi:hypothetical protein
MLKSQSKIARLASIFALLFALLSAGAVVAHQCHSESAAVSTQAHHTQHSDDGTAQAEGSSLLGDICVGIVFLALVLGSRFLLKTKVRKAWQISPAGASTLRHFSEPPNLIYALTLQQLGLSRI